MDGGISGYGSWGNSRNPPERPFMESGSQWQGYEFHKPMDVGGPSSSLWYKQEYGMQPDLPPLPERHLPTPEYEYSEERIPAFDRDPGFDRNVWQGEMGQPYWDRPAVPYQGFLRPFDHGSSRGVDDRFEKKKRPRIFSSVQMSPASFEKKSDDSAYYKQRKASYQASMTHIKDTKQQNGSSSKSREKKFEYVKKPKEDKIEQPKAKPKDDKSDTKIVTRERNPTDHLSFTRSTTFTCKLCKFETPDEVEIQKHFLSSQHLEIIKHLYIFLPKARVDFIQGYLIYEKKKVFLEQERQNLQKWRDSFKGVGKEHFFRRVSAAHCLVCDVLIPDDPERLLEHTKLESHMEKCKTSFKEIKKNCLAMAKEILQDQNALEMLKLYNKGQNPFKVVAGATATVVNVANTHEVLVAEEDDSVPLDEDTERYQYGAQNMEDFVPANQDSLDAPDKPAVKERNESNNEKGLIGPDIEETDEEEAAEAP